MKLPTEIVLLLTFLIGFVVTNGLKALFPKLDISGANAKITAALVTCVVALAEQGLGFVPLQFQPVVSTIFTLIISVIGAFGIHYSLKMQAKGSK